jgi:hypothetical protein
MPAAEIKETLSWVPFKVHPKHNDRVLSTATAFFYEHNDQTFLITNYHVVSGINPNNGTVLDPNGQLPNLLQLGVPYAREDDAGNKIIQWNE